MSVSIDRRPLLELLGAPLRRAVLRHYRADSCVASTAIGLKVLEEMGVAAVPMSVEAMVANAAFVQAATELGHMPRNIVEREEWFKERGAHAMGLGIFDPNADMPPYFNGLHVILFVENRWLWDLSIDQATRPQHGIYLERPFLGELNKKYRSWARGNGPVSWSGPNGIMIGYTARPKDQRFWEHPNGRPDGRDAEVRSIVAQEALSAMKGRLLGYAGTT